MKKDKAELPDRRNSVDKGRARVWEFTSVPSRVKMDSEIANNQNGQEEGEKNNEIEQITPSGYTRKCLKVGRYILMKKLRDTFANVTDDMATIKSMPMREDDVLLVTYPKSGTNWTSEILKMLISGKADYHKEYKTNEWLEVQSLEKLESLPSPRVLNTHLSVQDLPEQVIQKKCKVVLVHRNPKDVCVSFFHQGKEMGGFGGTFADFLYLFMKEQDGVFCNWFEFTRDAHEYANAHAFVHSLNFEDLKKNSQEEIKRLAKFLNVELSDELANDIAEKCSFSKLKKAASEVKGARKLQGEDAPSYNLFRKGEVADWKNWFTVAQNEQFDQLYNECMKECDIKIKFSI